MPDDCSHRFSIESLTQPEQSRARLLTVSCDDCEFSFSQLTMRDDAEIAAEIKASRG